MKTEKKTIACAIYTRVSGDQGLDQEFNSLEAQFDSAKAYIKSQAQAGWHPLPQRYDDGGFSGGNLQRPALQRLLDDVKSGQINVVVVYKIDRLTRSLTDFVKLVELFDRHGVSFAAATQPFNTTSSFGRLTLNVLLSFAQFERENTGERIRDKLAASKRRGLWVGGNIALGYKARRNKVFVEEGGAALVRMIFQKYLDLGTLQLLKMYLAKRGVISRTIELRTGELRIGRPYTTSSLQYLLRNRFYIGDVVYKGEILKGPQRPIIDLKMFKEVQRRLDQQRKGPYKALPPSV